MKGKGAPSAELLVCFPPRATLTLLPKPTSTSSPSRSSDSKRHHHLKKVASKNGADKASPTLWAKTKPMDSEIAEPTSPKVTCAGQIKVRPSRSSCKNWQSVMEEIEKLHSSKKHKKRLNWLDALGFKKDVMQFLTCLQSLRFDLRCFGSVPTSDMASDEDDEDENSAGKHVGVEGIDGSESSRTVFSKWFMVLQENQNSGFGEEKERSYNEESADEPCAPPPNALLLMRSRSAPAKSWLEEREAEEEDEEKEDEEEEEEREKLDEEEEKRKTKERLLVMGYDSDFYKISSDIAK